MSEADKMFEELGYTKNKLNEFIIYSKKEIKYKSEKEWEICLNFNIIDKCLMFKNKFYHSEKELKAINKKCQELGWI